MNEIQGRAALRQRAEMHAERHEWGEAIRSFEALLELAPGDADVVLQLSYMHSLAGHYRRARVYAMRAFDMRPTQPAILKELVARLRTFNEAEALLQCVRGLPPPDRLEIPFLIAIAAQLSYLNLQEEAIRYLDEARRGDPDYPPTLLSRAQVLIYLGRFDEARAELMRCLARAPGIPKLYWLLATLGGAPADAKLVQRITQLLRRPGLRAEDAAMLGFALHLELDRAKRHDEAWQALEAGCRAKRAALAYRPQETSAVFDALKRLPIAPSPSPRPVPVPAPISASVPIFIVGMHRSGTTLLEQLLDAHDEVRGIGELYDFTSAMRYATDHHCRGVIDRTLVERAGRIAFDQVGARYMDGIRWRLDGARFFTDKLPSNFLNIGFIAQALPDARILHMVRDPVETCFSNLRELFSDANPYSYDLEELAHFHGLYRDLMAHWHGVLPGRILDVSYARLTSEPEAVMREVSSFCGLEFSWKMTDPSASGRAVATASAVQVRGGIRAPQTPKWKPYEPWLQPLIARLQEFR